MPRYMKNRSRWLRFFFARGQGWDRDNNSIQNKELT